MAIKAEVCLQPERIPGAEANRANVRLVEQFLGEARRRRRRNRNLETVLASIAGARNVEENAIARKACSRHEWHRRNTFGRGPRDVCTKPPRPLGLARRARRGPRERSARNPAARRPDGRSRPFWERR